MLFFIGRVDVVGSRRTYIVHMSVEKPGRAVGLAGLVVTRRRDEVAIMSVAPYRFCGASNTVLEKVALALSSLRCRSFAVSPVRSVIGVALAI